MWVLRGVGFGLMLFAVVFVIYFVRNIAGGFRSNVALGLSAITGGTIYRPIFWLALILTLVSSCVYVRLFQR